MKVFLLFLLAALSARLPISAQTPAPTLRHQVPINSMGECEIFANADNEYRLSINGQKIMGAAAFNKTQSKKVTLYRGDTLTIWAKNYEAGSRGGVCVTILDKDGKQVFNTKGLKYAVQPKKTDWQTNPYFDEFKEPDFYVGNEAAVAGESNPIMAWGKGSDRHTLILFFKAVLGGGLR